ncbi:hypothetical protein F4775DRAFT_589563 [Biscogniauxia sp. FL1348]|nr:hypothetical protein F4775DRAFT_589563 [Biscogniauxia sp. FL1348]
MSGIVNKVKDAVTGHSSSTTHEAPEGTHGPHGSRVGNAADPRVDSDRDHRAAPSSAYGGSQPYTTGDTYTHSGQTGHTGTTGHTSHAGTTGYNTGSTNAGPHQSNLLNKADPRIDSDRSGRQMGNTAGDFGGSGREGVAGPHNSRIANAADPRVDSDRDASRTIGNTYGSSGTVGTNPNYGSTGATGASYGAPATGAMGTNTHGATGTHGTTGTHGIAGTHGTTGTHGTHGTTGTHTHGSSAGGPGGAYGSSGSGPAPNTAGPHKSDALNKMDPRVDSNLDGSKTYGGNKTYSGTSTHHNVHKDPTDAAQVPPSTLREHIGEPLVEHGDHSHHREHRNSLKTAQEAHRGL